MGTLASGSIDLKSLKVAGEGATSYITDITNNGIKVASASASNLNYVTIDATGMEIFKTDGASPSPSSISVAKFGEEAIIGNINQSHLKMNQDGFSAYLSRANDLTEIFKISASGTSTYITQKTSIYVNGSATLILEGSPYGTIKVTWGGHSYTFSYGTSYSGNYGQYGFTYDGDKTLTISTFASGQRVFRCEYHTQVPAPYYNLGTRSDSIDEIPPFSTIIGVGLQSKDVNSLIIGQYNDASANPPSYVFVIGNGGNESNRSNALSVDWGGHIYRNNNTIPMGTIQTYTITMPTIASGNLEQTQQYCSDTFTLGVGTWIIYVVSYWKSESASTARHLRTSLCDDSGTVLKNWYHTAASSFTDSHTGVYSTTLTQSTTYKILIGCSEAITKPGNVEIIAIQTQ